MFMKNYIKQPWTDVERNLLRDYYYILSKEELRKILPGRSDNAIAKQVYYLTKRNWSFKR